MRLARWARRVGHDLGQGLGAGLHGLGKGEAELGLDWRGVWGLRAKTEGGRYLFFFFVSFILFKSHFK